MEHTSVLMTCNYHVGQRLIGGSIFTQERRASLYSLVALPVQLSRDVQWLQHVSKHLDMHKMFEELESAPWRAISFISTKEIPIKWYSSYCFTPQANQHSLTKSLNVATSELSAALLSRARSIAKEHEKLRDLLGENFDSKVAKRMGELAPVAQAVKDWDKTQEVGCNKDERL